MTPSPSTCWPASGARRAWALVWHVRALAVVEAHAAPLVRRLLGRVLAGPHDHAPVADGDALPGRRRHGPRSPTLRSYCVGRRSRGAGGDRAPRAARSEPGVDRGGGGGGASASSPWRRFQHARARSTSRCRSSAAGPARPRLVHDLHVAPARPSSSRSPATMCARAARPSPTGSAPGAQRRRGGRGLHGHGLGVDGRAVPGRRRRRRGRRGGDGRPASAALIGRTGGRVAHRCPAVGVGRGAVPSSRRGLPDDVRVGPGACFGSGESQPMISAFGFRTRPLARPVCVARTPRIGRGNIAVKPVFEA